MAVDLLDLTEVITTALLRELGDEVDLIFRYGSFIKGNTHAYSDLDISYVPVHEATGYRMWRLAISSNCTARVWPLIAICATFSPTVV